MIKFLLTLFFCHFLADFTHLSNKWMLNAKKLGSPYLPIIAHAAIHSGLMSLSLIFFGVEFYKIAIVFVLQLITHFGIDLLKGKMNYWFPKLQDPANKWRWIVFGFDQYLHSIVIILLSYYLAYVI